MEKENIRFGAMDKDILGLKLATCNDPTNLHMTGKIIDRIYDKDMNLVDVRVGHNLVVNSFLNLVMCLLKHEDSYAGVQYWAIGSGLDTWDELEEVPAPNVTESTLTTEIGRAPIALEDIKFLDSNYEVIDVPSNILQISHTFGLEDCNGKWREFGIFGGNATENADSGLMINKRNHKIITKTDEMIVERTMRFTLNLV